MNLALACVRKWEKCLAMAVKKSKAICVQLREAHDGEHEKNAKFWRNQERFISSLGRIGLFVRNYH